MFLPGVPGSAAHKKITDQCHPGCAGIAVHGNKNQIQRNRDHCSDHRYPGAQGSAVFQAVPDGEVVINAQQQVCRQQYRHHVQAAPVFRRYKMFDDVQEKQNGQHARCRSDGKPLGHLRLRSHGVFIGCMPEKERLGGVAVSLRKQGNQRGQFVIGPENAHLPQIFLRRSRQQVFQHRAAEHLIGNTRQAYDDERRGVQHHFFPQGPVEKTENAAQLRT